MARHRGGAGAAGRTETPEATGAALALVDDLRAARGGGRAGSRPHPRHAGRGRWFCRPYRRPVRPVAPDLAGRAAPGRGGAARRALKQQRQEAAKLQARREDRDRAQAEAARQAECARRAADALAALRAALGVADDEAATQQLDRVRKVAEAAATRDEARRHILAQGGGRTEAALEALAAASTPEADDSDIAAANRPTGAARPADRGRVGGGPQRRRGARPGRHGRGGPGRGGAAGGGPGRARPPRRGGAGAARGGEPAARRARCRAGGVGLGRRWRGSARYSPPSPAAPMPAWRSKTTAPTRCWSRWRRRAGRQAGGGPVRRHQRPALPGAADRRAGGLCPRQPGAAVHRRRRAADLRRRPRDRRAARAAGAVGACPGHRAHPPSARAGVARALPAGAVHTLVLPDLPIASAA